MYLDERSNQLLTELVKNPLITSKELQEQFNLSRRQVDYSFQKINDWLAENGQPIIQKMNGRFRVEQSVRQLINPSLENTLKHYVLSEQERVWSIILYILTRNEELSLNHFIIELEVSKNTVLQDLKNVQTELEAFDLKLSYERSDGYYTIGEEWNKRSAMFQAIHHLMNSYAGIQLVQKFMRVSEEKLNRIRQQLLQIERQLHFSFTDVELDSLPYILEGIFKRIERKKAITTKFFIDYSELSDTREYEAVKFLIEEHQEISVDEQLYLSLQLLKSNTVNTVSQKVDELPKLKKSLKECLDLFERKAVIVLVDKELLLEKLFLHFKPAYYRIKYNLTTDYRPLEKISREFEMLHYFVKQSVEPLEKFLEVKIPENELMFITLFIGSHILEKNEQKHIMLRKKAVVVCPNGLSISQLMEKNLLQLFPELFFYPAMSIREYNQFDSEYDIVFASTFVSVPPEKQLFIVNPVMGERDKTELRQRVIQSVYFIHNNGVNIDQLLTIIGKYSNIDNEEKLADSLKEILEPPVLRIHKSPDQPLKSVIHLDDLIIPQVIQVVDTVKDWQTAIRLAARPLLDNASIDEKYVRAMQALYPEVVESIVLNSRIAVPHAATEDGVNRLGMSLLVIKNGIANFNDSLLHFVVVIAAIDKKSHFRSLSELMLLSGDKALLKQIRQYTDVDEIHQMMRQFVQSHRATSD